MNLGVEGVTRKSRVEFRVFEAGADFLFVWGGIDFGVEGSCDSCFRYWWLDVFIYLFH